MGTEQTANDAIVLAELQAGNRLLKQERYKLLEENELLKKALIEAQEHISTLSRKLIEARPI